MLYALLKLITTIALKIFFRSFHVRNAEFVPRDAPLIIAANHPSTLMDALVIGACIDQPLYFVARGNLFSSRLRNWMFKHLHMIPIYRKQDDPGQMARNDEIFRKCHEFLASRGALLIFPEGISLSERRIHKLKTGTARIALGAEAAYGYDLGVVIVPAGINYAEIGAFRSEVFINFARGIPVSDFFAAYRKDNQAGVVALTELIQERLEDHTIAIEDQYMNDLVGHIEAVYKSDLLSEVGDQINPHEADFLVTKGIIGAVRHFHQSDPKLVEQMRHKMAVYMRNLKRLRLRDDLLQRDELRRSLSIDSIRTTALAILTFPIYLYGLLNNYLPYKLPGLAARKLTDSIEYQGAIKLVFGIVTFPLFYGVQLWWVWLASKQALITMVYGLTLPSSGFFAFYYWSQSELVRTNLMLISLFYRRNLLISNLILQRRDIIKMLEKAKEDYLDISHGYA